MNKLQVEHLYNFLHSRHYERKLDYELYRNPVPIEYDYYPVATPHDLTDPQALHELRLMVRKHYHWTESLYSRGYRHSNNSCIRLFRFSDIKCAYGKYAWFFGIVAHCRVSNSCLRVMVKDVYTFQMGLRPKYIEKHIWINVSRFQALKGRVTVGIGDLLVFLAEPSEYHHINRERRHSHDIFYRHGTIKRGLVKPVMVQSYYPVVHSGRIQGEFPYVHGKYYLFRIREVAGFSRSKTDVSFGMDIDHRVQRSLKQKSVSLVTVTDNTMNKLKPQIAGRVRSLADDDELHYLVAYCDRNNVLKGLTVLSSDQTKELEDKLHGWKGDVTFRFYRIGGVLVFPLMSSYELRKRVYRAPSTGIGDGMRQVRHRLKSLHRMPRCHYEF